MSENQLWIKPLAGIRALAVISVVAAHDVQFSIRFIGDNFIAGVAVGVFFVLSGFFAYYVINGDVLRYGKINYSYFLWRRILRIWPAYFVTIFSIILITSYWGEITRQTTNYEILQYFTFTTNLFIASFINNGLSWLAPLWSIAVEEQFYLLAPLFFSCIRSRFGLYFILAIILFANIFRLLYLNSSYSVGHDGQQGGLYFFTYSYLDIFICGMGICHVYLNGGFNWASSSIKNIYFLLGLCVLGIVAHYWGQTNIPPYLWYANLPYPFLILGSVFIFIGVLPQIIDGKQQITFFQRLLSSGIFQFIGKISFSAYLVHTFVFDHYNVLWLHDFHPPRSWLTSILWIGILASCLYYCIERPLLRFKTKTYFPLKWPILLITGLIGVGLYQYYIAITPERRLTVEDITIHDNFIYKLLGIGDSLKTLDPHSLVIQNYDKKIQVNCANAIKPTVIVLIGQSNIANYNNAPYDPLSNKILNFNIDDGKCYLASDPILGASGSGGSFATRLGEKLVNQKLAHSIILVPIAMGQSRVKDWAQGGKYNRRIEVVLKRLNDSGLKPNVILWQQGESEIAYQDPNGELYARMLSQVIHTFRRYSISAPFMIGLSTHCNQDIEISNAVRKGLTLSANNPSHRNVFLGPDLDNIGSSLRYDNCHMNEEGANEQAALWASSIQSLINSQRMGGN